MPSYSSKSLLQQLKTDVIDVLEAVQKSYAHLPENMLLTQPAAGKWSIAQVMEHMNTYGRYYLLAIEKTIDKAALLNNKNTASFVPGWLGDYFTKMMLKPAKMKTPSKHIPPAKLNAKEVVEEFMEQQRYLLLLLSKAENIDLGKWRIPITLTKLIKLKLGDTFRFLIAHEQRHMIQIKNAAISLGENTTYTIPAVHPAI
ncbi:DinB family protein [Chitinophagaceae bacterium 26-R-25]|nr:DinB family protein [Chitinophagaceae bacterium 26-R-25]